MAVVVAVTVAAAVVSPSPCTRLASLLTQRSGALFVVAGAASSFPAEMIKHGAKNTFV